MAGRGKAPKTGEDLKNQAVALATGLGLQARLAMKAGRRIWGSRRIDE